MELNRSSNNRYTDTPFINGKIHVCEDCKKIKVRHICFAEEKTSWTELDKIIKHFAYAKRLFGLIFDKDGNVKEGSKVIFTKCPDHKG